LTRKPASLLKEERDSVLLVNPEIGMVEEEEDSLVMEAVAGPLSPKVAEQGMSEESQVADKIKDFMADEFVLEAEGPADGFLFIKNNGVVQAPPPSQAALAELGNILQKAKRSGRRDLLKKNPLSQAKGNLLPADERMGKINDIGHPEVRVRGEGQAGPFVLDFIRLDNANRANRLGDWLHAGFQDGLGYWRRTSV
jgi:hypothetical protein